MENFFGRFLRLRSRLLTQGWCALFTMSRSQPPKGCRKPGQIHHRRATAMRQVW